MVTQPRPGRRAGLVRAVQAYARQTHANRELIVVIDREPEEDRAQAEAAIAAVGAPAVSIVRAMPSLTLGALRNLSVAHASGDFICQWDDDDLHHPERIAAQYAALEQSGRDATILQEVMLYQEAAGTLRWLNWAATPAGGHPGTLLCRRSAMPLYPETGPAARRGEDLAVVEVLRGRGALHLQSGLPHLYLYAVHGTNTWPPEHLAMLGDTLAISRGLLLRREAALRAGLAAFDFGGAAVGVDGANGRAFTL